MTLFMAGILAASLTGCGKDGAEPQSAESSAAQTTAGSESQAAGDKTTITFINGFTGGDGPFMTKIVDAFNESQDQYYIEQLQDADH